MPWKFFKGVSPWFWSKNRTFYHVCFLGKLSKKRSFFDILNKKDCFLDQKNGVLEKSKKSTFFKGVSPLFLSKNRTFCHLCFLGKFSQKRSFFDILDKKECFLDRKKELLKSLTYGNLSKGLDHGFGQKIEHFTMYVFGSKLGDKRSFFDILNKQECF